MAIELYYRRYHHDEVETFDGLDEAFDFARTQLDNNEIFPGQIVVDGRVVWDFTKRPLGPELFPSDEEYQQIVAELQET